MSFLLLTFAYDGSFSIEAADVNQDGDITITDAVGVVNIILNNTSE